MRIVSVREIGERRITSPQGKRGHSGNTQLSSSNYDEINAGIKSKQEHDSKDKDNPKSLQSLSRCSVIVSRNVHFWFKWLTSFIISKRRSINRDEYLRFRSSELTSCIQWKAPISWPRQILRPMTVDIYIYIFIFILKKFTKSMLSVKQIRKSFTLITWVINTWTRGECPL